MIWLIGNKGMLGHDVEIEIKRQKLNYFSSDIDVDITNYDALTEFTRDKNIDWIINCSAYTAVDKAEEERDKAFLINGTGVLNIAKITKKENAKLIHISTDYVFDGTKKEAYREDDPVSPINTYGASKLEGEKNIQQTLKEHFIIRTAWLYGKNGNNFVNTMLRLFKERDELNIINDQHGSPTYTKDLAACIVHIINKNCTDYSIYHFSNEGKTTWYEFAKTIYDKAKEMNIITKDVQIIPIPTEKYPTPAKRPANSLLSKEKIKKATGFNIPEWQDALVRFMKEIY